MIKNLKKLFFPLFSLIFTANLFAQTTQTEGEKLFLQNNPTAAIPALESEILSGKASVNAYNYLGLSYYQTGNFQKSVDAFQRGLTVSGTNKKILAFNAGNSCYAMRDYEKAIEFYSLAISADSNYSGAVLNRANSYLMSQKYAEAVDDYRQFLVLDPNDSQNPKIRQMIDLLTKEIARLEEEKRIQAEEAARVAEEERKMKEEMARREAEKAEQERLRREEEERIAAEKRAEEERVAAEKAEAERKKREEEERIAAEKRAEEERIAAEKRAEEERIAAEKRAAESERRRKLLEDVAASLQNTGSTNMLSGAEDLIDYEHESELD